MRVSKKLGYYLVIGLLITMLVIPFFTTGENDTNPVDNLIIQEEETIENIDEPIEEATMEIIPALTAPLITTPSPTPTLINSHLCEKTNICGSDHGKKGYVCKKEWGHFKSYMYYTTITYRGVEYEIVRNRSKTCDKTGIRIVLEDNRIYYCIAVGTGWGFKVGDKLVITLSSGKQFYGIMTDTKANRHTKNDNKTMITDGSVIEFVVGKEKEVRKYSWCYHGTLGVLEQFNGGIISIEKI